MRHCYDFERILAFLVPITDAVATITIIIIVHFYNGPNTPLSARSPFFSLVKNQWPSVLSSHAHVCTFCVSNNNGNCIYVHWFTNYCFNVPGLGHRYFKWNASIPILSVTNEDVHIKIAFLEKFTNFLEKTYLLLNNNEEVLNSYRTIRCIK